MFAVRRVAGGSMVPAYLPGAIIVAGPLFRAYKAGDAVLLHHDGMDKVKRIVSVRGRGQQAEVYVLGDNEDQSTDSRNFGWLPIQLVKGKIRWTSKTIN